MDRVNLIYKVLSGEASAIEQNELNDWIGQAPENKAEFEDIKLLWASSKETETENAGPFDDGFDKIKARMRARVKKKAWVRSLIRTAGIIVLGLITFFFFYDSSPGLTEGLQFNDVTLEQAIAVIADKYNIHIEVEDRELLKCHLTLVLYKVKTERDVVGSLAHSLNVDARPLSHKRYKLTGSGCQEQVE